MEFKVNKRSLSLKGLTDELIKFKNNNEMILDEMIKKFNKKEYSNNAQGKVSKITFSDKLACNLPQEAGSF